MDDNTENPPSPSGGKFSKAILFSQKIFGRLSEAGGLGISAIFLVPVIAVLLYAVFLNSRENDLLRANAEIDAAVEAYQSGETDEALKIIREVGQNFGGLKIAEFAEYYEGAILFEIQDDRRSLVRMESFLSSSSDEIFRPEALFMAGVSSFNLEKWEKSIGYFEELISNPGGFHERRALPLLATAYAKKGDAKKAESLYARFAETFPYSDVAIPQPQIQVQPPDPAETEEQTESEKSESEEKSE